MRISRKHTSTVTNKRVSNFRLRSNLRSKRIKCNALTIASSTIWISLIATSKKFVSRIRFYGTATCKTLKKVYWESRQRTNRRIKLSRKKRSSLSPSSTKEQLEKSKINTSTLSLLQWFLSLSINISIGFLRIKNQKLKKKRRQRNRKSIRTSN